MFTTCPKCSLKLVVTAADLRVAQGYVRCGRCSNIFNALAALSDEQQAVLEREPSARPEAAGTAADAASGAADASEKVNQDRSLEFDPSMTDVSEVFIEPKPEDDPTGTFESIVLSSEDALNLDAGAEGTGLRASEPAAEEPQQPALRDAELHELELEIDLEELVSAGTRPPRSSGPAALQQEPPPAPSPSVPPAPAPAAVAPAAPPASPAPAPAAPPAPSAAMPSASAPSSPGARLPPAPERSSVPEAAANLLPRRDAGAPERQPTRTDRALRIGSALLALALVLQIIHHERAALADIAWVRGPLTAIYSALGMRVVPNWDVGAYEVRQLGAVAGHLQDAGALTVRASVKNTAPREQPLPLLRVTMQDRFGNRIAARDVPPSAYLPASADRTGLASGERVDAEIAFVDPGPNAVGFEIDACLRLASGRVACANDTGAQRSP